MVLAVVLANAVEHDRPRWNIDPHGEGFGGEEDLAQALRKQQLDHFLQDGQHAAVVNPDAPSAQLFHLQDLRQFPVRTFCCCCCFVVVVAVVVLLWLW